MLIRQHATVSLLFHSLEKIVNYTVILNGLPSTTPFGFALGPINPQLINIAEETLVFRCAGFSPALSLLIPTFSFVITPPSFTIELHCNYNAPLPILRSHSFGDILMPDYYPCSVTKLVSCYALFK